MANLEQFKRHQTVLAGVLGNTAAEEVDRLVMRLLQELKKSTPQSEASLLTAAANGQLLLYQSATGLWTPGTTVPDLTLGILRHTGTLGFHGTSPIAQQTVIGAKGGNAALTNLMTALAATGLLIDNTT